MFGKLAAYSGLSTSSQNNERVQRELATLRELSSMADKERQEEMMFQEMEAQQWDKIRQQSDMLLERDKQKISQKAISLQEEMKAEIAAYGSRKAFYANGGISRLRKYEQDILHSDEANRYKSNLKNLMLIQAAEMKNLGHRLTKQDRENLMKYHRGEDVAITYSGLKNEVEIPFDQYAYGEEIPEGEILRHGDNYTAIYGNFLLENPDLNAESMDPQELMQHLLAYTKVNYSGQGRSKDLLNAKIAMAKLEQEKKSKRALNEDGTPKTRDYAVELSNSLSNYSMSNPATAQSLLASKDGVYTNYITNLISKAGGSLEKLIGGPQNEYKDSFKETMVSDGTISRLFNNVGKTIAGRDRFQPASAYKIAVGASRQLVNGLYEKQGVKFNEDGSINIKLNGDGTFIKTNGDVLKSSEAENVQSKSFTPGTPFIGFIDSKGRLLVNVVDKDGNIITDKQSRMHEVFHDEQDNQAKPHLLIPLTSEDGEVIYEKFSMNTAIALGAINKAMGDLSDISSVSDQISKNQEEIENEIFSKMEKQAVIKEEYNRAYNDSGLSSPYIMQEQKMYQGETGNRNNLIQAYYMAVDHINNGRFSANSFVSSGIANSTAFTRSTSLFPNLQSYLLDYSHSDEQAIDEMVRVLSAETDDDKDTRYTEYFKQDDYDFNLRLGTLMKAYLNILNGNKK